MFPYTAVDVLKVWLYMDHTLNGGGNNLQPLTCTKRWSYMDHKLLKVVVVVEIAYILPLGPYTIIYLTGSR